MHSPHHFTGAPGTSTHRGSRLPSGDAHVERHGTGGFVVLHDGRD